MFFCFFVFFTLLRKRRAGALPWRNARVFRGLVALFVGELDGELAFHWLRCFWALLPESTYVKQRNPVFATARRVNLSLEELTKKANQASSGLDGRQLTFLLAPFFGCRLQQTNVIVKIFRTF